MKNLCVWLLCLLASGFVSAQTCADEEPTVNDDLYCQDIPAVLTISENTDYDWYTTSTGGTPIKTGREHIAYHNSGDGDVSYWIDYSTYSAGYVATHVPQKNAFGENNDAFNEYITTNFEAHYLLQISKISVVVKLWDDNPKNIQLGVRQNNVDFAQSAVHSFRRSDSDVTKIPGSDRDFLVEVPVNFTIPQGTGYSLSKYSGDVPVLFYQKVDADWSSQSSVNVTLSSGASNSGWQDAKGGIAGFFNWYVEGGLLCPRAEVVAIEQAVATCPQIPLTTPTISGVNNYVDPPNPTLLTASGDAGVYYVWYKDGAPIPGAQGIDMNTYSAQYIGNYSVRTVYDLADIDRLGAYQKSETYPLGERPGRDPSTKGKEFWLAFLPNISEIRSNSNNYTTTTIHITADAEATVTISMPQQSIFFDELGNISSTEVDVTIPANSTVSIELPYDNTIIRPKGNPSTDASVRDKQIASEIEDDPRGIHIVSKDNDVTVYAINANKQSADACIIFPVKTLGYEYTTVGSNPEFINRDPATFMMIDNMGMTASEFLVLATVDNTEIEIIPTQTTAKGKPAGVPFTVTLDAGEVYQVQAFYDLSGTQIRSTNCKKIAVFSGDTFTAVPQRSDGAYDHLYAHIPPNTSLGKSYAGISFSTRRQDTYKIVAVEDNTLIEADYMSSSLGTLTSETIGPLMKGETHYLIAQQSTSYPMGVSFVSDKKILVAHMSNSNGYDGISNSDPFMNILPPLEQTIDRVVFNAFPSNSSLKYYLNVIVKASDIGTVTLDGVSIESEFTNSAGDTNTFAGLDSYSFARFIISQGNHVLEAPSGCIAYTYGYGSAESYGYVAGATVKDLSLTFDVGVDKDKFNYSMFKDSVCAGDTLNFTIPSSEDLRVIKWIVTDEEGEHEYGGDSIAHTFKEPGFFDVKLIAETEKGCGEKLLDSISSDVFVNGFPKIEFNIPEYLCVGSSPLTVTATPAGGTLTSDAQYMSSNVFDPSAEAEGDYHFSYEYSIGRCRSIAYDTLALKPSPSGLSIWGLKEVFQNSDPISFTAVPQPVLTNEKGEYNGGGIVDSIFDPTATGTFEIEYQFTNEFGCTDSVSTYITVLPDPLHLKDNEKICKGDSVLLESRTDRETHAFSWEPTTGLSDGTIIRPKASPASTQTYRLKADYALGNVSVNGGFEDPTIMFNSDYTEMLPTGTLSGASGMYARARDPQVANTTDFSSCTSCSNMLIVQADDTDGAVVWSQQAQVRPDLDYVFSVNILSVEDNSTALLQFQVNGQLIGTPFSPSAIDSEWEKISAEWYSQNCVQAEIAIVNKSNVVAQNTFAIDDIGFAPIFSIEKSTEVVVNLNPSVQTPSDTVSLCVNDTTTILGATVGGTAPYVYEWTGGVLPLSATDVVSPEFSSPSTGLYSLQFSVEDANGCLDEDSAFVRVHGLPALQFPTLADLCENDRSQQLYTATPAGGTYSGVGVTSNQFSPSVATSGVYPITYTYTDQHQCTDSIIQNQTVLVTPSLSWSAIDPLCSNGEVLTLEAALPTGGTYFGANILTNGFNPQNVSVGNHDIYYKYTDATTNCSDTISKTLQVVSAPEPTITFLDNDTICDGEDVPLTGLTDAGTHEWTVNNISQGESTVSDLTLSGLSIGQHPIQYKYVDGNNCTDSVTGVITVLSLPSLSVSPVAPLCVHDSPIDLSALPVGGKFKGAGVQGNKFSPMVAGAGVHTLLYVYESPTSCSDSIEFTITVNPQPNLAFAQLPSLCEYSEVYEFTEHSPQGSTGYFYGTGVSSGTFDPKIAGVGNHTISYVYTDVNSCSDTISQTFTVNARPLVSLSLPDSICFSGSPYSLAGLPAGGSYSGVVGVSSGIIDPDLISDYTQEYSVDYIYSDPTSSCGDTVSASFAMKYVAPPVTTDGAGVVGVSYPELTAVGESITWYADTGLSSIITTGNSYIPADTTQEGNYLFSVTQTQGGCESKPAQSLLTMTVCEAPIPTVADKEICLNESNPTFSFSGDSIRWYADLRLDTLLLLGENFTPTETASGEYDYYVTQYALGCESAPARFEFLIRSLPVVEFEIQPTICEDAVALNLLALPTGGDFSISNVQIPNFDPSLYSAGEKIISYDYTDAFSCSNSINDTIEIKELPNVSITGLSEICYNSGNVDFTLSPIGGNFNGPGISGTSFNSEQIPGNYNLEYTYVDEFSCSSSADHTITIHDLPTVHFVGLEDNYCVSDGIVNLQADIAGGAFYVNGAVDPTLTPSAGATVYDVQYIYTDANNCKDTVQKNVAVHALPQISIFADSDVCAGADPIAITGSPSGSGGVFTGNTITNTNAGATFTIPTNAGVETILYTYTDPVTTCQNSENATITIHKTPLPIADNHSICQNEIPTSFSALGDLVKWKTENEVLLTDGAVHTHTSDAVGTVKYNITQTQNGCESAPLEVSVTVRAMPTVTSFTSNEVCFNELNPLLSVVTDASSDSVFWYNSLSRTNVLGVGYNYQSTETQPDVYNHYLKVVKNGCTIYPKERPRLEIRKLPETPQVNDIVICEGETAVVSELGLSINWYDTPTSIVPVGSNNSLRLDNLTQGDHIYYVTNTDAYNCTSERGTAKINVVPIPSVPDVTNIEKCDYDPIVSLQATGTDIVWYDGDLSKIGQDVYTPFELEYGVNTFYATQTIQGCKSDTVSVLYTSYEPTPRPLIYKDGHSCKGRPMDTLVAHGQNIEWYDDMLQFVSEGNHYYPTIEQDLTMYATQTLNGCKSDYNRADHFVHLIPSDKIVGKDSICVGVLQSEYEIEGKLSEAYTWEILGNNTMSVVNPTNPRSGASVDWFREGIDTLILTTSNGYCASTDSMVVRIATYPYPDFDYEVNNAREEVELWSTSTQDPIEDGDYVEEVAIKNYWFLGRDSDTAFTEASDTRKEHYEYGWYYITIQTENEFGCSESFEQRVFVESRSGFYIPNAFVPESESVPLSGFNAFGYNLLEYEIWIFDAWGNTIWYSNLLDEEGKPINPWRGVDKQGNYLPADNYVWRIRAVLHDGSDWPGVELENGKYSNYGNVLLLR